MHRREARHLHRFGGQATQRFGTAVVGSGRTAPPIYPDRRGDIEIFTTATGGDAVVGESGMRFHRTVQGDSRILGAGSLGVRQHVLGDAERFLAREHQMDPVLITVTCRNRAGGHPWLTALVCPGSPLPSADVPHRRYVDWSPTPSHDAQKSGVLDW